MRHVVTVYNKRNSVVCRSICDDREPCKKAELIEMPFLMWSGPIRVHITNGISISSAVFAGLTIVTDRPTDRQTNRQTMLLRLQH